MDDMSVDFGGHEKCEVVAFGTPGVADGLPRHCRSPSSLITPMPQMHTSGQHVVPGHMAGLMPSVYTWGPLADPMCPR